MEANGAIARDIWHEQGGDAPNLLGRREQIYIHAAQLFCTKGFAATSMANIADAVGITKAGLYHFVPSKEELLFTLMTFSMDRLEADVIRPAATIADPIARIRRIVRGHLESVTQVVTPVGNPLTMILEEQTGLSDEKAAIIRARKSAYFQFVRSTLNEIKAQGHMQGLDTRVATFAIFGIILWLARWHRPDGPLTTAEIVDQLTRQALRTILPDQLL
ncbi:MAG: TetR family transcriptional regulator [Alphaproteobacteria bacterium]|nr:TetR family transcriptional regulator [Alphaproteobacteria bacterium]